jgi:hypothetical protein
MFFDAFVIVVLMIACVLTAIGVLTIRDRIDEAFRWRSEMPERVAAVALAQERRLLTPDWAYYERHLQRAVPEAIRGLYRDCELILSGGFQYDESHYISSFGAIDSLSLLETRDLIGVDVISLASSDGDILYLRPGRDESDAIYITYHDGGDTSELAPDAEFFVQRLREKFAIERAELAAVNDDGRMSRFGVG